MKAEFLKNFGLEQDAIDKIMAENAKDVSVEQEKTKKAESEANSYKEQLETATASLEKFKNVDPEAMKGEIESLNQQLKDQKAQYEAQEADRVFKESIKTAIREAGGRNEKSVMALLDMDALKASKNQSEDIKKALETVKESDAYLFGSKEPIDNAVTITGGAGSGSNLDAVRAAMGLPAKKD